MNKVFLAGRIANEIELRKTQSNISLTDFNLAIKCGRGENEHPIFINCKAWRNNAEFIAKYFKKGDQIIITGFLDENEYKNKEGKQIKNLYVTIEEIDFGAKKQEPSKETNGITIERQSNKFAGKELTLNGEVINDDYLPFYGG